MSTAVPTHIRNTGTTVNAALAVAVTTPDRTDGRSARPSFCQQCSRPTEGDFRSRAPQRCGCDVTLSPVCPVREAFFECKPSVSLDVYTPRCTLEIPCGQEETRPRPFPPVSTRWALTMVMHCSGGDALFSILLFWIPELERTPIAATHLAQMQRLRRRKLPVTVACGITIEAGCDGEARVPPRAS